jgi:hypothetical protein
MHHEIRGIHFDATILSLLPEHYMFAEWRASGLVPISNLAECRDTTFSPYPKGGCLNFANIKADPFYTRHKSSDERATLSLAAKN